MKKTDLLIIDAQNDFCEPEGALYVGGAREDSLRLAEFITENSSIINNIYVTLDSHHNYDIAHPLYWVDSNGCHPDPFTVISVDDVNSGRWKTSLKKDRDHGLRYVGELSQRGKYQLCIWPPHCLIGSWGTQIQEDIFRAICSWETEHIAQVQMIYKGYNPSTEHYGAFEAEVPMDNDPSTKMRTDITDNLKESDSIIIAGQALDYCVANTVRQLAGILHPDEIKKIILLGDCCSSVDPSSGLSSDFLKEMIKKGMISLESLNFTNEK